MPSARMDGDLRTLHAPEAAAEVVDEGCRRARERGQIDIVRSATYIDTEDKRMAIRRAADIGAQPTTGISAPLVLLWHGSPPMI